MFRGRAMLAEGAVDHPRVIVDGGVAGSEPERFVNGRLRFLVKSLLVKSPRQHVAGINVGARLALTPRGGECLVESHVVVGPEEGQRP